MACLFCNIIAGELPSQKVYEDDTVIGILDIRPVNPGHTLIIPKKHYTDMLDTPDDVLAQCMTAAKKVGDAVVKSGLGDGFNLGVNNRGVAGQVIFHTHLHVMPRTKNDGHKLWAGQEYKEGEIEEVAGKIKKNI